MDGESASRSEPRSEDSFVEAAAAANGVGFGQEPASEPRFGRRRKRLLLFGAAAALLAGALLAAAWQMVWMPGKSFRGAPPPLSAGEELLRQWMRDDLQTLALTIGERNVYFQKKLQQSVRFIEQSLQDVGYQVERQTYEADQTEVANLEVSLSGSVSPEEIVVVGAHYDTVFGSPGANDNGSGVVALLALARLSAPRGDSAGPWPASKSFARTLRYVFFVNEEPPFFLGPEMGSMVYARRCRERGENVVAMISLETMGCFSRKEGSQKYPIPALKLVYPSQGDFIAFVGNFSSRALVRRAVGTFRKHASAASEGAALPSWVPGVGSSDHYSFWVHGYPAIMITDTAPFRYEHYHAQTDLPDKIDYDSLARVVAGVKTVVDDLAGAR